MVLAKKQTTLAKKTVVAKATRKPPEFLMRFKSGAVSGAIFQQENKGASGVWNEFSFNIQRSYTTKDKDGKLVKDENGKTKYEHTNFMRKKDVANFQVVFNEIMRTIMLDEDEQKETEATAELSDDVEATEEAVE